MSRRSIPVSTDRAVADAHRPLGGIPSRCILIFCRPKPTPTPIAPPSTDSAVSGMPTTDSATSRPTTRSTTAPGWRPSCASTGWSRCSAAAARGPPRATASAPARPPPSCPRAGCAATSARRPCARSPIPGSRAATAQDTGDPQQHRAPGDPGHRALTTTTQRAGQRANAARGRSGGWSPARPAPESRCGTAPPWRRLEQAARPSASPSASTGKSTPSKMLRPNRNRRVADAQAAPELPRQRPGDRETGRRGRRLPQRPRLTRPLTNSEQVAPGSAGVHRRVLQVGEHAQVHRDATRQRVERVAALQAGHTMRPCAWLVGDDRRMRCVSHS